MNVQRILARFLSLMDVTLLLLGFFMIMVAAANLGQEAQEAQKKEVSHLYGEAGWNFIRNGRDVIWLFAECEWPNRNKCFVLNEDLTLGEEVDQVSDVDIRRLIAASPQKETPPLVVLTSEKGAFDQDWDSRLALLEKKWGCEILRVRGVEPGKIKRP